MNNAAFRIEKSLKDGAIGFEPVFARKDGGAALRVDGKRGLT